MGKEKVRGAVVITLLSLLYFVWLVIVILQDQGHILANTDLVLNLQEWAIIGIILYAIFVIVLVYYYLTLAPKEESSKGIKLVSAVTTRAVCDNCHTVITISDTGTRPLRYDCPNCSKQGTLRHNTVEGTPKDVACERCEESFEIYDTGERPLTYECSHCHFEGVLTE
jgi:predicted RNA-binding Zn-ribbon protein involved in translation (DUF1610 family)